MVEQVDENSGGGQSEVDSGLSAEDQKRIYDLAKTEIESALAEVERLPFEHYRKLRLPGEVEILAPAYAVKDQEYMFDQAGISIVDEPGISIPEFGNVMGIVNRVADSVQKEAPSRLSDAAWKYTKNTLRGNLHIQYPDSKNPLVDGPGLDALVKGNASQGPK